MCAKVMLVSPPSYGNELTMVNPFPTPPLGLCVLKNELRKNGHNVMILDAAVVPFDFIAFKKIVVKYQPDVVGITTYYQNLNIVYLAQIVRSISKKIKIVLGGVIATKLGSLILETDQDQLIDVVITGTGIKELIEVANCKGMIERNQLFTKVGSGYINKDSKIRNEFNDYYYLPNVSPVIYKRFHYVFRSGCPFQCAFCVCANQLSSSVFDVNSIIKEINLINDIYGCNNFILFDETLTIYSEKLQQLSEGIQNKDITFWGSTRVDCLDESKVGILKKLNVNKLFIGVESTKSETQKCITNKAKDKKLIKDKIELLHKAGIKVETSLLIGLPFETKSDFEKSLEETLELGFDYVMFTVVHVIPGTELYMNHDKYGYLFTKKAQNLYELLNENNYRIDGKGFVKSLTISSEECDILLKEALIKLNYKQRYGKPQGYVKKNICVFPY